MRRHAVGQSAVGSDDLTAHFRPYVARHLCSGGLAEPLLKEGSLN